MAKLVKTRVRPTLIIGKYYFGDVIIGIVEPMSMVRHDDHHKHQGHHRHGGQEQARLWGHGLCQGVGCLMYPLTLDTIY